MNIRPALAALAAGLLAASCGNHKNDNLHASAPTIDVAQPEVDSVTLSTTYPGELTAAQKVNVVARVNGQLMSKSFEGGQYVRKGTVLFRIEDSTYRDAVQQAEASLATALSTRDYAASHYEAVKKAFESNAVSRMEVKQAESSLNQAEASIKNAKAALESARTSLSYCTITAPISGLVSNSTMDVGNYVNGEGSAVVMTTIYNTSSLTANFSVGSDQTVADSLLTHIPLMFSDPVAHQYHGDLSYVAPTLDTSTGTLLLQCKIPNTYNELRPGMYVKVNLPYKVESKAILVKDASISTDQLGKYLYVVNDSGTVVYTPIKVGPLYHDSLRVVESGINPDSRYVTKALLKVKDGMKVNPHLVP